MSATFIVGSARSGTTSLLKVLGLSKQAHCLIEPIPNLNMESREMLNTLEIPVTSVDVLVPADSCK